MNVPLDLKKKSLTKKCTFRGNKGSLFQGLAQDNFPLQWTSGWNRPYLDIVGLPSSANLLAEHFPPNAFVNKWKPQFKTLPQNQPGSWPQSTVVAIKKPTALWTLDLSQSLRVGLTALVAHSGPRRKDSKKGCCSALGLRPSAKVHTLSSEAGMWKIRNGAKGNVDFKFKVLWT